MVTAAAFFFGSLAALALLFALKAIEVKRGRAFAPALRERLDGAARSLKAWLIALRHTLSQVPPALLYLSRIALRELALAAAKLARIAETQSHRIADLVSHKRSFEKREPRSEFLKQVGDAKREEDEEERV